MYSGRRVFRAPRIMIVVFIFLTAVFAGGGVAQYRVHGWNWVSIGLIAAAIILGVGSIIETLILRIELTDDAMIVTELLGRKRYGIAEIERVEEARGVPPALLLKDGRWVKLPSVASNLGNSVRAWLKRP